MRRRWEWLIKMIQDNDYTLGAEVGVARGKTTVQLLANCPDLKLYCIDNWVGDEAGEEGGVMSEDWNSEEVRKEFFERIGKHNDRILFINQLSWLAADRIDEECLDFVFIDADHRYESVRKDIESWLPTIKPGGIICGHDTHFEGVKKAIDELLPGWQDTKVDHVWFKKV